MKIHLIGLNHGYQLEGCRTHDWERFDEYLLAFCKAEGIDLVAEELSEWAIQKQSNLGAVGSVARNVASRLHITHRFCDPDEEQRKQWPIRECFWLTELRQANGTCCVFILGAQHVDSFRTLLAKAGFDVTIKHRNWEA
jgi:hypothetical protein